MAVIKGNYYSQILKMESHFSAVSPADSPACGTEKQKVLILLHGLSDCCDTWMTQTHIEQYAMEHNILVFMPEGHRSFWLDTALVGDYQRLLAEEVPKLIEQMFGTALAPDNTMIAGNSMGGFGALYTVLKNPGKYAACGAFSPVISPVRQIKHLPGELKRTEDEVCLFGATGVEENQYDLCSLLLKADETPRIFLACGTEDFLIEENIRLHHTLDQARINHTYCQTTGKHEWKFWDRAVKKFIEGGTGYF